MELASSSKQSSRSIFFGFIVLLAFLAGVGYLLIVAMNWISGSVAALPKELQAALIAGFATVTASVVVVTAGRYAETRSKIGQELRSQKAPVYEEFFKFFIEMSTTYRRNRVQISDDKVLDFFDSYTPLLMT